MILSSLSRQNIGNRLGDLLGLLAVGFVRRVPSVRWAGLFIFAVTVGKAFLHDMAGLKEIYRILAFFILAVLLGLAGWAYQRIQLDRQSRETNGNDDTDFLSVS